MKRVLITGMSGTGKSTVIHELAARGFKAVDTDWDPEWEQPPALSADGPGWLWREDRIAALLDTEDADALFVSACVENQGKFIRGSTRVSCSRRRLNSRRNGWPRARRTHTGSDARSSTRS